MALLEPNFADSIFADLGEAFVKAIWEAGDVAAGARADTGCGGTR